MSDRSGEREKKGAKAVVEDFSQSPPALPFDKVVVAEGALRRNLSPAEFFALPLAQRILHVVQQKAEFFADGHQVDPKEVLSVMRKLRAQLH